ncbi:MAG: PIN domain-containing protein [Ginsengibacter sp.]
MNNVLIDTNILVYGFNEDSIYHERSKRLLSDPLSSLFITSKNISEFFAETSKLKADLQLALIYYFDLKLNSTLFFPTKKSLFILETLIKKYQPVGNRVYDFEIVSMMLDNDLIDIATFNRKDFISITEIRLFDF